MSLPKQPLALLLAFALAVQAFSAPNFPLTIDNIMRGPNLVGYEPTGVRWSGDSERIYFQWKQASDPEYKDPDTCVVNRDGSGLRKLSETEAKLAPPVTGDASPDRKRVVYSREGDVFIHDRITKETRQVTRTTDAETNPRFTRDGRRIYFTRANNLYVLSLVDGALMQMTDIESAGAPRPTATAASASGSARSAAAASRRDTSEEQKGSESQEYLKKEEKELLQIVRERAAKKAEDEARKKRENPRKPFHLGARQSVASLQLSPDEKLVIATINEAGDKDKKTLVPNFVTESAYTEEIPSRDKVGDQQGTTRIALIGVEKGDVTWVESGQKKTPPAGAIKVDTGKEIGEPPKSATEREREIRLLQPVWSEDGSKAVLMARAADNKDRWVLALDPATGKTRTLVDINDDAWVDGPGAFSLGWLKGDRDVYFQSEKSGYSQLYAVSYEGGEPRALTSGRWEVEHAVLSKDKNKFFLTTSESDPGDHELYEMNAQGGPRVRITSAPGHHSAVVSPDERWIADVYSYINKPPDLYVQANRPAAKPQQLTSSSAPDFKQYPWLDVPIVTFQARDGATLRGKLYRPPTFRKGGPAVLFVHGAGYLQDIHRGWSSYYHEYLFHHVLMDRGFLVFEVDYRGSAGYGRDWRTAIYEHMGGKDLTDNVDAARWLVAQQGVDPKRIGIYGGSYGGFITLMAMFTTPGVFAAGAALRPVSDWAHYNHPYTANILNTPQEDPEAYKKSSPIYFANGLQGALLICHGMVDTNVHFQDTVRLVQRLIELRKTNWDLAVYPVENHGFVEPTSWADEYKRILELFERSLKSSS